MVSIFEGRLSRTYHYEIQDRVNVITLYHDPITGLRSVMLNYQEVPGSSGISAIIMGSGGHRMYFTLSPNEVNNGYIEILRDGLVSFTYKCVINGQIISEVTAKVGSGERLLFDVSIDDKDTMFTPDESDSNMGNGRVAWYLVKVVRLSDKVTTAVHRRFRDFADLNSNIKQNFKGHHLRSSLPSLPDKTLKFTTNHLDPAFIEERRQKLESFLKLLIDIPHVCEMTCTKAFLGLMDKVRELSFSFRVPTIGLTLNSGGANSQSPAIIRSIENPSYAPGLYSGDAISKINGVPIQGETFKGIVARIHRLPRPLIIHFVQVIASPKPITNEIIETSEPRLPSFSGDDSLKLDDDLLKGDDLLKVEDDIVVETIDTTGGSVFDF